MKIVLDVVGDDPKNNDIIVFKNGQWTVVHKDIFLKELIANVEDKNLQTEKELNEIKNDLVGLAKMIKEK